MSGDGVDDAEDEVNDHGVDEEDEANDHGVDEEGEDDSRLLLLPLLRQERQKTSEN